MRNIMHAIPLHNRLALPVTLLCGLLLGGCGDGKSPPPADETAADAAAGQQNEAAIEGVQEIEGVRIVTTELDSWLQLVGRTETGETLHEASCASLLNLPGYRILFGEQGASSLEPIVLKTVIDYVFSPHPPARTPKRVDLMTNFQYLSKRRDLASAFATNLATPQFRRTLRELAERFVGEALPPTVTVHAIAATTSIGFLPPGELALDAGLAYAAGPDLAARLCASRLYDALRPMRGLEPHQTSTGTLAFAATFRKLHHRAIFAWIVGTPVPEFDYRHAGLGDGQPAATPPADRAARLMTRLQDMLGGQLGTDGEALRAEHGGDIDRLLREGSGYEILGFAMADLIVRHAGLDGLDQAAVSPGAFFEAYQAAATALDAKTALPAFAPADLRSILAMIATP